MMHCWTRCARSGLALGLVALFVAAGCATAPELAPVNLRETGWQVRRGQALWQPSPGAIEVAGELLLATHADGRCFVQFSKPPLDLALARTGPEGWELSFPVQRRTRRGRGAPPRTSVWFQLAPLARGEAAAPRWQTVLSPEGWQLADRHGGERLKAVFAP